MKTNIIKMVIALLGACTATAYAATTETIVGGNGPLIWLFIGFGVLVVMLQLVPALILFVSMLRGLFSASEKEVRLPKV
ncbi:MAG: hypothetical protein J0665_12485 [Deltaproteobacteria bacterium]|nr:hypothetical protein [Deltaproteobacteria bacterium]